MAQSHSIRCGAIEAAFSTRGAELLSLKHRGVELLWNGDAAWWDFRAPLLFPVVGKSPDGMISISGIRYPMPPHGFARDRNFRLATHSIDRVAFELSSDALSRSSFPFDFKLELAARVGPAELHISATVENLGPQAMPYCFGYHPGFLWPQADVCRKKYICLFEHEEAPTIRRANLSTGLLFERRFPSPLVGRTLALQDSDFQSGALQFDSVRSRRVWFGKRGAVGIECGFPDCPQFALWTRPGAPFLCIEPWQGMAANEDGNAELRSRIGARILPPFASAVIPLRIRPGILEGDALTDGAP